MFEAIFWMFKHENFKKHFMYLFTTYLIFLSFGGLLFIIGNNFISDSFFKLIFTVVPFVFYICPFLCFQGYFWSLTENIIYRQTDIASSNIYNGKVKEVYKIYLPEISTKKFIWRGIASIVASALLCYPFIILVIISTLASVYTSTFYDASTVAILYIVLFVLIGLLIPALLWNYAKQDSVFAVWNFPKAIHIMGTYFGKYIWNTLLFLVLMFVNYCLSAFLTMIFGMSSIDINGYLTVKGLMFLILEYAISIYWIYVNAYLLGTIAPANEG